MPTTKTTKTITNSAGANTLVPDVVEVPTSTFTIKTDGGWELLCKEADDNGNAPELVAGQTNGKVEATTEPVPIELGVVDGPSSAGDSDTVVEEAEGAPDVVRHELPEEQAAVLAQSRELLRSLRDAPPLASAVQEPALEVPEATDDGGGDSGSRGEVDVSKLKQGMRIAYTPPNGCRYEATVGQVSESGIRLVDRTLGDRTNIRRAVTYTSPKAKIRHIEILRAPGDVIQQAAAPVAESGQQVAATQECEVDDQDVGVKAVDNEPVTTNGEPVATPKTAYKLPVGRAEERDPRSLDEHPLLRRLFELESEDANRELGESLRGRQYQRVLVTGQGCASPPDMTLDGRRRRRETLKLGEPLQVEVLDDLTAEMEAKIIIHANIASGLARRYDEQSKAALERHYIELYGKKQGQRTDLGEATSVQTHGSDRRETTQIVADIIREEFGDHDVTPTAVHERQLIFYGPASSELLKQAVKAGKVARRPAADLVRKVEKEPEVATIIREARASNTPDLVSSHPTIIAAKKKLLSEVETLLGRKRTENPPPPKPPKMTEAWGAIVEGAVAISNILGHKMLIQIEGGKAHVVVMGPADGDPTIYVPDAPTTRLSWVVDVAAVVAELAAELRTGVTMSEVEVLDPVTCPRCEATQFYEGGGCPRCDPVHGPDYDRVDAQVRRQVAKAVGSQRWEVYRSWPDSAGTQRKLSEEERAARRTTVREVGDEIDRRKVAARAAALEAARVRDPRLARNFNGRVQNLRYARSRIRIITPKGEVPVVLWEREADYWGPYDANPNSPCVVVPNEMPTSLNSGDIWSRRRHLRHRVRQTLTMVLEAPREKTWPWMRMPT